MLPEVLAASFLLVCLVCFFSANLHNIVRARGRKGEAYAEVKHPAGFLMSIVAAGTLLYFLLAFVYLFLVFTGSISGLYRFPYHFHPPPTVHMQVPGLVLTAAGHGLFIWSVRGRGEYAVSWQMPEDQRLVTWGPYRYVRHPSYAGYFLMFVGLFLLWPNVFTILPLAAIPGYVRVTFDEEKLLVQRFGEEYEEYRKKAGRFIPGLR